MKCAHCGKDPESLDIKNDTLNKFDKWLNKESAAHPGKRPYVVCGYGDIESLDEYRELCNVKRGEPFYRGDHYPPSRDSIEWKTPSYFELIDEQANIAHLNKG